MPAAAPKPILLVEDSDDDALLFTRALQKAALRNPVHRVPDLEQAICWLKGDGKFADRTKFPLPSILFLDLKLPGRDGFQLLEWIGKKPEFRLILVVVMTGIGRSEDISKAYRMGANSFISKPPKAEDLRNLAQGFAAFWRG